MSEWTNDDNVINPCKLIAEFEDGERIMINGFRIMYDQILLFYGNANTGYEETWYSLQDVKIYADKLSIDDRW